MRWDYKPTKTGWWFQILFIFHFIYGNFIIPTDELIFFRGVGSNHQPGHVLAIKNLGVTVSCWISSGIFTMEKKNMVFPTLFCNGRPLPISGFCFGFRRSDLRQEWEKLAPTVPWRDGISKSECAARSSYMSNVEECNNGNVTLIVSSN